jgi:hypothetical protein
MRVQITNAGIALLNANTGPIQVASYQLGSDYGYIPEPTDTGIHGSLIYTGSPSQYFVVNSNVVKYSIVLDYSLGPFNFGEIGLFTSTGVLFALAVNDSLLDKIPATSAGGNAVRMDIYLSMVNQNYAMWLDYADTNSNFRMAVLNSVDQLPPTAQAAPNAYVITGAVATTTPGQQSAFLAYTDQTGLWNFDAYAFANQQQATIVAADALSVTINNTSYSSALEASYYGQLICQFSSGVNYSICRYVQAVVVGATQTVISFYNQVLQVPIVGDTINFFARQSLSTTIPNLPIATTTDLGGVIVGSTLLITPEGVLNVNAEDYPVLSVNGMTGDVEITASDITGLATVATTGKYSDLIGAPGQYILPIATTTTVGGVKITGDGNLTIAGDGTVDLGFAPVKMVNGTAPDGTGNVTIAIPAAVVGLVDPTQVASGADLNTYTTTGLFFCMDSDSPNVLNNPATSAGWMLDVETFSTTGIPGAAGGCVQRLTTGTSIYFRRYNSATTIWTPWVQAQTAGTIPVATTTSTGVISVGTGLNVTVTGVLSTQIQTVNGYNSQNITLHASDVSAVPSSDLDVYNGIPTLNSSAGTAVPATDPFTYGRMNFWQNTLGAWVNNGYWDANANHVQQSRTIPTPTTPDTNTSLVSGGQQLIDISYGGIVRTALITTSPDYQTVSAEGYVYEVKTAGTTNLDGTSVWNVGDLAVCVNGGWIKIAAPGANTLSQSSGYRTNSDGTIEMWGIVSLATGTNSVDVTLPVAIPTGILNWSVTDGGTSNLSYGLTPVNSTTISISVSAYYLNTSGTITARPAASGSWRMLVN